MISNACSADLPTAPVLEGQDPATRFAESRHPANRAHLEGLLAVGAGGDGCSCLVHLGGHLLPHYLRMRRAMLSACSESCSRLLTSLATEWRDRFGWSFQMASASLCHRCHCAALVAGPDVGRSCGLASVRWAGHVRPCEIKSTEHARFHARRIRTLDPSEAIEPRGQLAVNRLVASRVERPGGRSGRCVIFLRLTLLACGPVVHEALAAHRDYCRWRLIVVLVPPTLISGLCNDNIRRRFRIRRRLSRDVGADLPRNNLCSRALGPRGPILDCPDRPGLRIFRDLSGYRDHHRGRDAFSIRDPFRDLRDPYGRRRRDASSNRDPSHDHPPSIGRDRSVVPAVAGNSRPAGQELFAAAPGGAFPCSWANEGQRLDEASSTVAKTTMRMRFPPLGR